MNLDPIVLNTLLLTTITFLPMLGSIIVVLLPSSWDAKKLPHKFTLFFTILTLGLSVLLALLYNPSGGFQFIDKFSWIPNFDINYHLGVDGLSLPMVVLTTIIMFIACLASWNITQRPRLYFFLFLVLETGILGVFTSLDLVLFFIMWELELIPMYFLIGVWGGPRREYAAIKFILYTVFGSALMLISFLAIYFTTQPHTFSIIELLKTHPFSGFPMHIKYLPFIGIFICFAIKLPMCPLHTWLPDAHVEAPTPISVILAGVLLKMGAYGIIRINFGLFPDVTKNFIIFIAIFGVINIIYGAFLTLAQDDMKRVIAYSSISHMGFVFLGLSALNPLGINGGILQMFSHGLITALLFLFVGIVYDRTHTRSIKELGGIVRKMPLATALFIAASLAAVGAPGFSGFVSEFLVFLGAYQTHPSLTVIAATGIVLTAAYMLWLAQRVCFGEMPAKWANLTDANGREIFYLVVLLIIVLIIGVYPSVIMDIVNPATMDLMRILG